MSGNSRALEQAATAVASADALLIGAGAGMSVDSGLPDFRGPEGFWRAYPAYKHLGLRFEELANPEWFATDPELAWGFYGHRLNLYRETVPHRGFAVLRRWAERMRLGCFVFTSNVDGQFQKAGFGGGSVLECHGAIDWLQCTRECGIGVFPAEHVRVEVDGESFRAVGELPRCPACGALVRPNILMFGDWRWDDTRTRAQEARFQDWAGGILAESSRKLAVVECGAGVLIPTVRWQCERLAAAASGALIRINPRDWEGPRGTIPIVGGAAKALEEIGRIVTEVCRCE